MIKQLLNDHNIKKENIFNLLDDLCVKGCDYADLYFQYSESESWVLDDGIVKDCAYNIIQGVGARSVIGDKTGFSYSDDLDIKIIKNAIDFATGISNHRKLIKVKDLNKSIVNAKYPALNPIYSINQEEKIAILRQIDTIARKNNKVKQVSASLSGSYSEILITSSDGIYKIDPRPMVRINVSVMLEDNGRIEQGFSGGGGRYDYKYFIDNSMAKKYTLEAVRIALVALESKPAPAGKMPVILGSGWPGVLLHEAVGHGLEGDFNRKKTSVFTDKIGQEVANKKCTIVDNGTIANRRGSLNIDDEGTPTQKTTLIEKGILKSYMFDKLNAKLMGQASTGNARRESYAHIPMPRMTNTYMLNGKDNFNDMITSVDKGIYAKNFDGGQVDITSGNFVFSANESYLIEKGKITKPIKGATLIGNGSEALHKISMVGDDLQLDSGVGICGKDGQSVPVGVGQPSLKIDSLTVGGTQL